MFAKKRFVELLTGYFNEKYDDKELQQPRVAQTGLRYIHEQSEGRLSVLSAYLYFKYR